MPNNPENSRPTQSAKQKAKQPPRQQARYDPQRGSNPPEMIDLIEGRWILKALGGILAVAFFCAYATICFLFMRSQWQLVLHPKHTVVSTPSSIGLSFTEVHFGVNATGQPQLDGWWVPSGNPSGNPAPTPTVLFLHNGDQSISDALPIALTLHDAHLNILLFDYRGYGHSSGLHPTEASMEADTETALTYLTTTRSIPDSSIVVYGNGVGGSLAVRLCAEHHDLPALILQSPDGDFESRARHDLHSSLVPVSLFFTQKFPLATPLHKLTTPKLLISVGGASSVVLQRAADPKTIVELQPGDTSSLDQPLTHFLSAYLQHRHVLTPVHNEFAKRRLSMTKWLNSLQPWGAFLLRLALGYSIAMHGYDKVVPHGALHSFVHYVAILKLPYWLGYISAYTEFIGGILLILGLLTRFCAALVAINLLVAFFTVGIHQGFGTYNYILDLAAIAIMLLFYGAGKFALDRKLGFA